MLAGPARSAPDGPRFGPPPSQPASLAVLEFDSRGAHVTLSTQGAPDKPDGFTCSTCQRVVRVVVWQGVKIAVGTKLERTVVWQQCVGCWSEEQKR